MKTYRIEVRWSDRRFGPQVSPFRVDASNIRTAVAKGLQSFLTERKQRGDKDRSCHAAIQVSAVRVKGLPGAL